MPDAPKRIQRSRVKGSRLPPNTICVTRPGPFGNLYHIDQHTQSGHWFVQGPGIGPFGRPCGNKEGAQLVAVKLDREWIMRPEQAAYRDRVRDELRGKNLACWCGAGMPCHADVRLEIANAE